MVGLHIIIDEVNNGYVLKRANGLHTGQTYVQEILIYKAKEDLLAKLAELIFEKEVISVEVK